MTDLAEIISQNADSIRQQWSAQLAASIQRSDLISKTEVDEQCRTILDAVEHGVRSSGPTNIAGPDGRRLESCWPKFRHRARGRDFRLPM